MFWKRRKDSEDGSRGPNAASREAIMEWREYERGERDLEVFEPISPYNRQGPLGSDHVYKVKQTSCFVPTYFLINSSYSILFYDMLITS